MKKAVKLLALLIIITLLVVSVAACVGPAGLQGAKGDKGDTGPAGAAGLQGPPGPNAQIVAVASNGNAIGYVQVGMGSTYICVLGSNFVPGAHVHLTICELNTVLKECIEVNKCGTLEADVVITPAMMGVVSIKAWVDQR